MKTIILDNGHGADTPGKRSPKWADGAPQFFEYAYNRRLVQAIHARLKEAGIRSVILVPETEDIPLRERTARANEIAMKSGIAQTLVVSVHGNASINHDGSGWEIWTSEGHTKSDDYAKVFLDEAYHFVGSKSFCIRGIKESNFYILKHTACPAVLTENLFFDNRRDYDFLMSQEGFDAIVNLHVSAILKICSRV